VTAVIWQWCKIHIKEIFWFLFVVGVGLLVYTATTQQRDADHRELARQEQTDIKTAQTVERQTDRAINLAQFDACLRGGELRRQLNAQDELFRSVIKRAIVAAEAHKLASHDPKQRAIYQQTVKKDTEYLRRFRSIPTVDCYAIYHIRKLKTKT
jgi:hypothetical protein